MTATEAMTAALITLIDHDQTPPCAGGDAWVSDYLADRIAAATLCRSCPILEVCRRVAAEIRPTFGVWGARDYTPGTRHTHNSHHPSDP